jgi:hypothetical protein
MSSSLIYDLCSLAESVTTITLSINESSRHPFRNIEISIIMSSQRRGPLTIVSIQVTSRRAKMARRAAKQLAKEAQKEGYGNPFGCVSSEVDPHTLMWPVAASRISCIHVTLGYFIGYV